MPDAFVQVRGCMDYCILANSAQLLQVVTAEVTSVAVAATRRQARRALSLPLFAPASMQ